MENKLIFFVDDDKMILHLMEYTFKSREGCQVRTFFSGEDCIAHLDENPSIIVLDHILSSHNTGAMSGMEALKTIHTMRKDIPIIILSQQPDKDLIDEFMKNGATRYISKDEYFIDSMIETIEDVLNLQGQD